MTQGIAVLGTGRIVETGYVPALRKVEDARLVAVLSRDQSRGEAFAAKNGFARAYTDLDRLLADPEIDAVIIATPDGMHDDQTIAAARAGKHILCEKPMALTLDRCERMVEAVSKAGVTFAMGYDNRFNPLLQRVKDMIEAGRIGTVRHVRALVTTTTRDPNTWRASGPESRYWAMSSTGTHIVDVYRWFFGEPARVGGGYSSPVFGGAKDEIAIIVLDYPGRLLAELTVASILPATSRFEVHGEKGEIRTTGTFGHSHKERTITVTGPEPETITVGQGELFRDSIADFLAAARDRRPPRVGIEDGLKNVRIMETAWTGALMRDL